MHDDEVSGRVQALEHENARLRRLLDQHGSTTGLRHQTRNTLAMLRDVVRRSAETSETVEDYAAHLDGRLDTILRIQNTIANSVVDGVGLHSIIADELRVYSVTLNQRLSIEGPTILMQPTAAGALALAFHELATNALKFGALGVPDGCLAVTWTIEAGDGGQPCLALDWIESGEGVTSSRDRFGFGSEVIERAVPHQLGGTGTLDFTPTGLQCRLRLPMSHWLGSVREMPADGLLDSESS